MQSISTFHDIAKFEDKLRYKGPSRIGLNFRYENLEQKHENKR